MTIAQQLEQRARQKGRQEGLQEGRQEGLQEGRQEGLQEGEQKGRQEAIYKIARQLLDNGVDRSIVVQATGLSNDELNQLSH
jgi:predicted transposase/invertase (TIGR01784 family)